MSGAHDKTRRFLSAVLAVSLLLAAPAVPAAEDGIRGFDPRGGYAYIAFGSFPYGRDGGAEAILWRVLTVRDGGACLLSEHILEARPVHHDSGGYRGWAGSDLEGYLNGAFRKAAFTPAERYALLEKDGSTVTLPSAEDLKNAAYGFISAASRQAQSTAYAKAGGLLDYGGARRYGPYWTSTPSERPNAQRRVMQDGALGFYAVDAKDIGVRPMVWLDLGRAAIAGGGGTAGDPYLLTVDTAGMPVEIEETPAPATPAPAPAAVTPSAAPAASLAPAPAGTPRGGPDFPLLNARGFLDAGEYVYEDAKAGLWQYASSTLRLVIRRREDPAIPLRWYEAEIFAAENEAFHVLPRDPADPSALAAPADIAKASRAVYAQNADGHLRRAGVTTHRAYAGVIIRDGEIRYDDPPPAERTLFPTLDLLALMPGGGMQAYPSRANAAAWYIASGARDVLSYGPCLVDGGAIAPDAVGYGVTPQARSGIGMIEPGHYFGIVAEGRTDASAGTDAAWMARRFQELGCTVAFNLEGGSAAAMVFLGTQVNQAGLYAGSTLPAAQNEVLGIGRGG